MVVLVLAAACRGDGGVGGTDDGDQGPQTNPTGDGSSEAGTDASHSGGESTTSDSDSVGTGDTGMHECGDVMACDPGDGCCPAGCTAALDDDCSSLETDAIPPARRIPWEPGVPGGIPHRTEVCGDASTLAGDDVTDDAAAIQALLDACPHEGVVELPPGTYRIGAALQLRPHVSLRGAGQGVTILRYDGSDDAAVYVRDGAYDSEFGGQDPRALLEGGSKGSTTLVLDDPPDWNVGDYVLVDELNDAPLVIGAGESGACTWCGRGGGARVKGQLVRVVELEGESVTIAPALYSDFGPDNAPELVRLDGAIEGAGLESLTIDNREGAARDTIVMEATIMSWVLDVELIGSVRRHVWAYGGFRNEFRGNTVHTGAAGYEPDHAYGLFLGSYSTAWLVADNIFHTLLTGIAMEGAVSGNVIAYNFATNAQYWDPEWAQAAITEHAPHAMMNLVEGNWLESKVMGDNYWGSASHNTYWRNRIFNQTDRGWSYGLWVMDIMATHTYENIVGNVLGSAGFEDIAQANGEQDVLMSKVVLKFGYTAQGGGGGTDGHDPAPYDTAIIHGNWNAADGAIGWDPGIDEQSLPPSLYRIDPPAWFGDVPWPPIGPDPDAPQTLREHAIPAKLRYSP